MCRVDERGLLGSTGWGKILSVLSVGHCEGRGGWGWARKVQVVGKFLLQHSAVVKMVWSNEQRAFAVETYFSQSHSIVVVQRAFCSRYQIHPQDRVPDWKSILLWVENFRETGSVSEKRWGRPRTSRTPENIEAVRRSVLQSPRRSARKQRPPLARYSFSDYVI